MDNPELIPCPKCGGEAEVIDYFISGIANRINYFVRCPSCRFRTRNRRKRDGAISDWNLQKSEAVDNG